MVGNIITGSDGIPLDEGGNKLSQSAYQPSNEIKKLFARVQQDYQIGWRLHHRPYREFDGHSLLQRARLDQELFGAYVADNDFIPIHKRWRWKGRKNTARNKLMGILSRMISGMLYPYVRAKNADNEDDKMTARVMRLLVEDHLKHAKYETKFLYLVLSALVNPAVFCEVEYVEAFQTVKQQLADGKIEIKQAIDHLLSGLQLNSVPIDEMLLGDFYIGDIQRQPYIIRVRRIGWDEARKRYAGKYFDEEGKDQFDYVQAGMTRIVLAGQDYQTLYDINWTEADRNFVQEITAYYKSEDLQVNFVGGVFLGNMKDPYNTNPFKHRRMILSKDEWVTVPIYPFAKTYFEPLDPTGRFVYGKSGAFKSYWDDASLNRMHQLAHDGTYLDVIKPMFLSGVAKVDSTVIAPGATVGMPQGASATPYSIGPNLKAAYDMIAQQEKDLSVSTQDNVMSGMQDPNVTATQTAVAVQQAKIALGVFGIMIADLIEQIGALTMDCVVEYATQGELDSTTPEALKGKFKTFLSQGKDRGKEITNRIVFSDKFMGKAMTEEQQRKIEWGLYKQTGAEGSDQRLYIVNPYQFARYTYTLTVDADKILDKSMGKDKADKLTAFNIMTDPRVAPYTDQEAVVDDFVIQEYGGDDPDKYKKKATPEEMVGGQAPPMAGNPTGQPQMGQVVPPQPQQITQ